MSEPSPLRFGDLNVPGIVLRGFIAVDPELRDVMFHSPNTNGTKVKTLGLLARPIIVPMCVHSNAFKSYRDVQAFLRRIESFKGQGKENTLSVPVVDGYQTFANCYFKTYRYIDPKVGILQDLCGTLGGDTAGFRWFVDLEFMFIQTQAAR